MAANKGEINRCHPCHHKVTQNGACSHCFTIGAQCTRYDNHRSRHRSEHTNQHSFTQHRIDTECFQKQITPKTKCNLKNQQPCGHAANVHFFYIDSGVIEKKHCKHQIRHNAIEGSAIAVEDKSKQYC